MDAYVLGHRIHYERIGRGRPIYFLHGGPGLDHTYFRPWVEALADSSELIFFDLLGNGRSERPDVLDCGIEGWAEQVDGLRDVLGHTSIDLVAHSFGAIVAVMFALLHPDRVRSLVLVGAPSVFEFPGVHARRRGKPMNELDDVTFRQEWLRRMPEFFHRFEPRIGAMMDERTAYSARANVHGISCLATFDAKLRLAGWSKPTLIVTGRHDRITTLQHGALRLASFLPGAELAVFESSGHFPFIEEPDRFNQIVDRFLDRPR